MSEEQSWLIVFDRHSNSMADPLPDRNSGNFHAGKLQSKLNGFWPLNSLNNSIKMRKSETAKQKESERLTTAKNRICIYFSSSAYAWRKASCMTMIMQFSVYFSPHFIAVFLSFLCALAIARFSSEKEPTKKQMKKKTESMLWAFGRYTWNRYRE